jgi:hypothetical protein
MIRQMMSQRFEMAWLVKMARKATEETPGIWEG